MVYDVIIIGSGPAGYTAAIYSSRAFLKTLVISGYQPGGQLTTTTEIDNFPGFPNGILGPTLMEEMRKQAMRFGTEIQTEQISSVEKKGNTFVVKAGEQIYEGRSIIIATGAQAKELGISGEETYRGKGVSYCATCDGFFFKGKTIAVVGGGDTAMEEATFLTKFAEHVTIIHRRNEFRASAIMLDRAKQNPKISFLTDTVITALSGDPVLSAITVKNVSSGEEKTIPMQGVFGAIGHTPATEFLRGFLDLDDKGYVVTPIQSVTSGVKTATSVLGVFVAGDCADVRYRQGVVAAGGGAMAAIDAERWLDEQKTV